MSQWLHVGMVKLAFPSSAMRPKCEACVSTSAAIRGERRTFACTSTGQKGGRHPFLTKPFGSIPAARFPRLWSPASTPTYDRNRLIPREGLTTSRSTPVSKLPVYGRTVEWFVNV